MAREFSVYFVDQELNIFVWINNFTWSFIYKMHFIDLYQTFDYLNTIRKILFKDQYLTIKWNGC